MRMLSCGGGLWKLMRTGWAQRPREFVMLKEVYCIAPRREHTLRRSGMARVLKGSHIFTCTSRVHPLTEWTIPAFSFQPKLVLIYRPRKVREIWRATSVQSFEGKGGKFKPYTPFNRKPMELFEKFICSTRMLVQDNPSRCMLDSLKAWTVYLSEVPYRMEFNWSRCEKISAGATETALLSSNDERICLKERM